MDLSRSVAAQRAAFLRGVGTGEPRQSADVSQGNSDRNSSDWSRSSQHGGCATHGSYVLDVTLASVLS